jgi:hypothetical protein
MAKGWPDWLSLVGIKKEIPTKTMYKFASDSMGIGFTPYVYQTTGIEGTLEEISIGIAGTGVNYAAAHIEIYKDGEATPFLDLYLSDFVGGVNLSKNIMVMGDYWKLFHHDQAKYEAVLVFNTHVRFENGFKVRYYSSESGDEIVFWTVIFWEQEIV